MKFPHPLSTAFAAAIAAIWTSHIVFTVSVFIWIGAACVNDSDAANTISSPTFFMANHLRRFRQYQGRADLGQGYRGYVRCSLGSAASRSFARSPAHAARTLPRVRNFVVSFPMRFTVLGGSP